MAQIKPSNLTKEYCRQYHVELVPDKTKLLVFVPAKQENYVHLQMLRNNLQIDDYDIELVQSADHVGVLRSPEGNMPHILSRVSAHTRSLMSILPTGMALRHRGNPAASLRLDKLHSTPVLISGLPALVLSDPELAVVQHHHKVTIERLQRLLPSTPECVVYFLGGSLPLSGILHLRMFSLLGMIARLGRDHILNKHGMEILLSSSPECTSKSWFLSLRPLAHKYDLPDPLLILQSPPSHYHWKSLCKSRVIE